MPLFEIAVVEHPSKKQKEDGGQAHEKLVMKPEYVVAKDGPAAAMSFVIEHAEELKSVNRDRMEVLVRPFK